MVNVVEEAPNQLIRWTLCTLSVKLERGLVIPRVLARLPLPRLWAPLLQKTHLNTHSGTLVWEISSFLPSRHSKVLHGIAGN